MRRAVVEDPFLPLLVTDIFTLGRFGNDETAAHSSRLRQEAFPLVGQQVPVEMAREYAVELTAFERQRHRIALDDPGSWQPSDSGPDHLGGLIETHDLAPEVLGQKSRSARNIQNAGGRKARE